MGRHSITSTSIDARYYRDLFGSERSTYEHYVSIFCRRVSLFYTLSFIQSLRIKTTGPLYRCRAFTTYQNIANTNTPTKMTLDQLKFSGVTGL